MAYTKRYTVLDMASSGLTSADYLVQDAAAIAVQSSAVTTIVFGSNSDGHDAALVHAADYSTLTTIATAGMYTIEPGPRWLKFESFSSQTVQLTTTNRR